MDIISYWFLIIVVIEIKYYKLRLNVLFRSFVLLNVYRYREKKIIFFYWNYKKNFYVI